MVLVPLVSLAAVRESSPPEIRLAAAPPSTADGAVGSDDAADRVARFDGAVMRSSRSAAQARVFQRANEEATTTAAPTTTRKATTTTARTTTTTAKPTTTTAKAVVKVTAAAITTTTLKATTTSTTSTTAKPATTTSTMGAAPACCREEGGASYYDYPDPRNCAHKSLPKGTALKVTNLANGKTTTCVVSDRGPYVTGRIIDLSKTAFSEIASISDGVIRVSIEW